MKENEPDKINLNVMRLFAEENREAEAKEKQTEEHPEKETAKKQEKSEKTEKIDMPEAGVAGKEKEPAKKKMSPGLKNFLDWIKVIAIAVAVAIIFNTFIIINSVVPTGSMESTIMTGTRMIGFRLSYLFSDPQQGDIVIFKYPDDEKQIFVKRVIGTPGDTVEIIGGVTYVNGEELDEPYLNETPYENDFGPYVVPEGSYFVMGDNRNHARDARYWNNTYATKKAILAKAIFSYWPFSEIGVIR